MACALPPVFEHDDTEQAVDAAGGVKAGRHDHQHAIGLAVVVEAHEHVFGATHHAHALIKTRTLGTATDYKKRTPILGGRILFVYEAVQGEGQYQRPKSHGQRQHATVDQAGQ